MSLAFQNGAFAIHTLTIIASGALTKRILDGVSPRPRSESQALSLQVAVYGLFPYAITTLAFQHVGGVVKALEGHWANALFWLLIIFVGSSIQGWFVPKVTDWTEQKGIFPVKQLPSAWEKLFFDRDPCYIVATLNDGRVVGGQFGTQSLASRRDGGGDLFLQNEYVVGKDGYCLERCQPPRGVWVEGDNIVQVRIFWSAQEEKNDRRKRQEAESESKQTQLQRVDDGATQ